MKNISKQKGFIVTVITFLILVIMLGISISMSSLVALRQKISTNIIKSTQAYYAAESGIEDSLIRLNNNPQMSSTSYNLTVNGATAAVTIPNIVGGSRTITSQGTNNGIIRNIQTVYGIDSSNVYFYYGVEVGEGGLTMNNGSGVQGNVFSNGDITGGSSATIDNDAIVSGNGHSISTVHIKGNAFVYSCTGATVDGNLTYVAGGTNTCTVTGSATSQPYEIASQPLPIPQSQIDDWKNETSTFCDVTDISNLSENNESVTMGPCKVVGDVIFGNSTILTLTGTLYVTGNLTLGNTDTIKLDSSYNTLGGVVLVDGEINTGNGNIFTGSGQTGSYLLFLSTSSSDNAITVSNGSTGAAFYTTAGSIYIPNNVSVLEATGYKLRLGNNAKIQSSSGVVNIYFSTGPGGGWAVKSWEEK